MSIGSLRITPVLMDTDTGIITPVQASSKENIITRPRKSRYTEEPNGHWDFPELMNQKNCFGFIYLIRNKVNGRAYIGSKQYVSTKGKVKGQETTWRSYTSSSKELVIDVKQYGLNNFDFVCLEEYHKRGTLGYAEAWTMMHVECFVNQDRWYNGYMEAVTWKVSERITERHKQRLDDWSNRVSAQALQQTP
jgi:hypothetical protein